MIPILDKLNYKISQFISKSLAVPTPGASFKKGQDVPSIQSQKEYMERFNLSSLFGYESYSKESDIYINEDSIGFCIEAAPSTGITEQGFKILEGMLTAKHEKDSTIQFTMVADSNVDDLYSNWGKARTRNYGDSAHDIFETLTENRKNYLSTGKWNSLFRGMPYVVRDFKLIISYTVPTPVGADSSSVSYTAIQDLVKRRETIIQTLKTARMSSRLLIPEALINIVSSLIHPSDGKERKIEYDENELIKDQMVSSETIFLPGRDGGSIITKDKNISVLPWSVRQFPRHWRGQNSDELIGAFMDNIRQIPCPFITTLSISFPDVVEEKGKIKSKNLRATQMSDSGVSKYVPAWKERAQDWKYIADKVQSGSALVKALYQVVLFAPEGREEECEQALDGLYDGYGWFLQKDRFIPVHGFLSALPMSFGREFLSDTDKLRRFRRMLTWNAINIAPLFGEPKGDPSPCLLMHGRRGQVMNVNPYDNKAGNFNIACAASSGAGKSFFTHEFLFSVLGEGGKVFVIDSGRSYEETVLLLGGSYLDFADRSRQIILNPFTDIADLTEQMPLLKIIIGNMASPDDPIDSIQKTAIEKSVNFAYKKFGKEATITKVVIELIEMNTEVSKDLAEMLYPYTKDGVYGSYFEGAANIDFSDRFVVLELDDLGKKPGLQEVVLLILMLNINEAFYHSDRSQKKLCIIDEAWRLLAGSAGEFIEEGYRVARKYGGAFMTVTQSISDYYKSPVSRAAYANADHVWLLRQKDSELLGSIERGEIDGSQGRAELLKSLKTERGQYSEIAFLSPAGSAIGRLIVDPITEKLYSTQAAEVQYIRNQREKGVPLMIALEELAKAENIR